MRGPGFTTGSVPASGGSGGSLAYIDSGLPGVVFDMRMLEGTEMEDSVSGYHSKMNLTNSFRTVDGMRMLYMRVASILSAVAGVGNSPNIVLLGEVTMCVTYVSYQSTWSGSPVLASVAGTGETEATNITTAIDFDSVGRLEYMHESAGGTNRVKLLEYEPPLARSISMILARDANGVDVEIYDGGESVATGSTTLPPTGGGTSQFSISDFHGCIGQVVIANERWPDSLCKSVSAGVVAGL